MGLVEGYKISISLHNCTTTHIKLNEPKTSKHKYRQRMDENEIWKTPQKIMLKARCARVGLIRLCI